MQSQQEMVKHCLKAQSGCKPVSHVPLYKFYSFCLKRADLIEQFITKQQDRMNLKLSPCSPMLPHVTHDDNNALILPGLGVAAPD